jgi:hypothetical protein
MQSEVTNKATGKLHKMEPEIHPTGSIILFPITDIHGME